MSPDYEQVRRLLPAQGAGVSQPPWNEALAAVGFSFPSDYATFVDDYGHGFVSSEGNAVKLFVRAPSVAIRRSGLTGFQAFVDKTASEIREDLEFEGSDEEIWYGDPYPFFPEPGGLLAWGDSSVGDLLFWSTVHGDPDQWPVVMWPRHQELVYRFDGGMVAFLLCVLRGDHPATWLAGERPTWTMQGDWLASGLRME